MDIVVVNSGSHSETQPNPGSLYKQNHLVQLPIVNGVIGAPTSIVEKLTFPWVSTMEPFGMAFDGTYLYFHDAWIGYCINKMRVSDGVVVARTRNNLFNPYSIKGMTSDGTHLYVTGIGGYLVKLLCSDLSYVAHTFVQGVSQLFQPRGICHDGTYLYMIDTPTPPQIYKALMSDLSNVTTVAIGLGPVQLSHGVCTDGTHIYTANDTIIEKRLCSDLSVVAQLFRTEGIPPDDIYGLFNIDISEGKLYTTEAYQSRVSIRLASDLSYVASFGSYTGNSPAAPDELDAPAGIAVAGSSFYFSDQGNCRIQKRSKSVAMTFEQEIRFLNHYHDLISLEYSSSFTFDSTYIYIYVYQLQPPFVPDMKRIYKASLSTFEYVAHIDLESNIAVGYDSCPGMTTDGTHLYVATGLNGHLQKRLCSDLSLVSEITGFSVGATPYTFTDVRDVAISGSYLYVGDNHTGGDWVAKLLASDMTGVAISAADMNTIEGICTDSTFVYVSDYFNSCVVKKNCSDLVTVAISSWYPMRPTGVDTDGTHVFVNSSAGNLSNPNEIVKLLCTDLSHVNDTTGGYGYGPDQFHHLTSLKLFGNDLYYMDVNNQWIGRRSKSTLQLSGAFWWHMVNTQTLRTLNGLQCVAAAGNDLYIALNHEDRYKRQIVKFTFDGTGKIENLVFSSAQVFDSVYYDLLFFRGIATDGVKIFYVEDFAWNFGILDCNDLQSLTGSFWGNSNNPIGVACDPDPDPHFYILSSDGESYQKRLKSDGSVVLQGDLFLTNRATAITYEDGFLYYVRGDMVE